jgi:hypothetical protein
MLRVASALDALQAIAERALAVRALGGACEHGVDRGRDQLDVPVLLGGDVGDEIVEGTSPLTPRKLNDWKV